MRPLNLSLDSVVKSICRLIRWFISFKCLKFSLELFVVSVVSSYHLGHGADDVGVEANATDHPDAGKHVLDGVLTGDVSEANGGKSL